MYLVVKYDLMLMVVSQKTHKIPKKNKKNNPQRVVFLSLAFLQTLHFGFVGHSRAFSQYVHAVLLLHRFMAKSSANSIDQNPMLFPRVQK